MFFCTPDQNADYNTTEMKIIIQGGECTSYLEAILCRLKISFTYGISYCKDNIQCDSASNAPKCPLNNCVSIVQKRVVKLSNTSTTFSQQGEITL